MGIGEVVCYSTKKIMNLDNRIDAGRKLNVECCPAHFYVEGAKHKYLTLSKENKCLGL